MGAFQGALGLEGQSIPLDLTVSYFNLSVEGSIKVDHVNLKMLPLGLLFNLLKNFIPILWSELSTAQSFKSSLVAKGQWENTQKLLSLNLGSPSLDVTLLSKIWYPLAPKVREWILKDIPQAHIKNLSVYLEGMFPPSARNGAERP